MKTSIALTIVAGLLLSLPALAQRRTLTVHEAPNKTVYVNKGYRATSPPGQKYVSTGYNPSTGGYDPSKDERGGRPIVEKRNLQRVGYRSATRLTVPEERGKYVSTGYRPGSGTYRPEEDQTRAGTVYRW